MTNLKEDAVYWYKDGELIEVEAEIFATLDRPININEIFKEKERLQSQLSECKIAAEQRMETIDKLRSNPPLKFDDLEPDIWVWDNKNKIYNLIYETRINCAEEQEIEFQYQVPDIDGNEFINDIFEDNRFYRKEVKE